MIIRRTSAIAFIAERAIGNGSRACIAHVYIIHRARIRHFLLVTSCDSASLRVEKREGFHPYASLYWPIRVERGLFMNFCTLLASVYCVISKKAV